MRSYYVIVVRSYWLAAITPQLIIQQLAVVMARRGRRDSGGMVRVIAVVVVGRQTLQVWYVGHQQRVDVLAINVLRRLAYILGNQSMR